MEGSQTELITLPCPMVTELSMGLLSLAKFVLVSDVPAWVVVALCPSCGSSAFAAP